MTNGIVRDSKRLAEEMLLITPPCFFPGVPTGTQRFSPSSFSSQRVRKLMYTKDMILNSKWYDPNKKYHTHPCFFGSAEEIIKDCCGACPPVVIISSDFSLVSLPKTLILTLRLSRERWHGWQVWGDRLDSSTVNPGAQGKIGSFHPITEGDWTEGAYISPDAADLFQAVNADNTHEVQQAINGGVQVDSRDPVGSNLLSSLLKLLRNTFAHCCL